jgi:oligopeptide/dipeptide ABC transporter ATP-binding protein
VNSQEPILEVRRLTVHFPVRGGVFRRIRGRVHAVDDVSFEIEKGKTMGLVGESGCGKTTVGRSVLGLYKPTSGEVLFDSLVLAGLGRRRMKELRRHMQMIFQDPFESLDARQTVAGIIEEPLEIHGIGNRRERRQKVIELLNRVGLQEDAMTRFPHEFSGGQRQRIGIARAIALTPRLLVCDEPVSALDVSIQSQVLNLLLSLQKEMGLTYLFIAHDLSVVKHMSDTIAVMYLGKIVEFAEAEDIYKLPLHPYTRALISAIPVPVPGAMEKRWVLAGEMPSPIHPPTGCHFHTRCPMVIDRCRVEVPLLRDFSLKGSGGIHRSACHRAEDMIPSATS